MKYLCLAYEAEGTFKTIPRVEWDSVHDAKLTVTDEPFAETKEQLGGYFLSEARDFDEAIQGAIQMARRALR
jgi:hypothetical protein